MIMLVWLLTLKIIMMMVIDFLLPNKIRIKAMKKIIKKKRPKNKCNRYFYKNKRRSINKLNMSIIEGFKK